jgi:hypothetical protein
MRILSKRLRTYVEPSRFELTITFYEKIHNTQCDLRFEMNQGSVNAAIVGDMMIFSGTAGSLASIRQLQATFFVDSLDDFVLLLIANGGEVVHLPQSDGLGRHLWVRNPDDLVVEYLESELA